MKTLLGSPGELPQRLINFIANAESIAWQAPEAWGIRRGQSLFNTLYSYFPDLADKIRGDVNIDPFYSDENIPAFWEFVIANWDLTERD